MEDVKKFICDFIAAERELKVLQRKIGIDEFNKQFMKYSDFLSDELKGNLGITERHTEYTNRKVERYKNLNPPRERELFKIEKYQHQEFDEIYFAYVSNFTPPSDYKNLDEILIIDIIESEYKIIGKIFLPHFEKKDDFTIDNMESPINLEKLEKFIESEVFQSPDEETIPFTSAQIPLKTKKR